VGRHSAQAPPSSPRHARPAQSPVTASAAMHGAVRSRSWLHTGPVAGVITAVLVSTGAASYPGGSGHAPPDAARIAEREVGVGQTVAGPSTSPIASPAERSTRVSRRGRSAPSASSAASADPTAPPPTASSTPKSDPKSTQQPGQTVAGSWRLPSDAPISSCYCPRWGTQHEGLDFAGRADSPIFAVGDGVVVAAGPVSGFGHWVVVRHANGDVTIYGHMFTVAVTVGQHVSAGQRIADVGSDGQSTGPHLHLAVRVGGINGPLADPIRWLAARGVAVAR
jgi:murein DD-endopeptidase MepM/ murein hydrolase activator NlpD